MISQSTSLGVNCTFCHNSRQFSSWEQAPPQRVTAYAGIQMLRDLNTNYLAPLAPVYHESRLGPMGDAPKAQCLTCHNGVYKPLYGFQMAKHYPALWGGRTDWTSPPPPQFTSPAPASDTVVTGAAEMP
jgi:photosynthetic reaction center cytochrome c subunit